MSFLCCLSPAEFTIVANLIGVALAEGLSTAEQNALANLLVTIGQALTTIASQTEICESEKS